MEDYEDYEDEMEEEPMGEDDDYLESLKAEEAAVRLAVAALCRTFPRLAPPLRAHASQRCDDDEHHACCCSAAPLHKPWSCAWPPPSAVASSTRRLM